MAAMNPPLVVIVGETASGKTVLGIELAQKFNGEIICADSRTVYRGMDIGTAKPTRDEQKAVAHHLIDIIEPNKTYSAAQFKKDAQRLIYDIFAQGKLPIVVGGTGLYVDSLLFDYRFSSKNATRDTNNPRHLDKSEQRQDKEMRPNTLVIGVQRNRSDLRERIESRVDAMIRAGFIDEVRHLVQKYGSDSRALNGIGYSYFTQYIEGEISLEEARQKFVSGDMSLARRQRTWFKRNKSIHWLENGGNAVEIVTTFLNNFQV